MDRDYKYGEMYFYCTWEDSQGIYTTTELKDLFSKSGQEYEFNFESNKENSDCIGWTVVNRITGESRELNNLASVITYLINTSNSFNLVGICDNMRIQYLK
jgi:hypothetical protein